MGNIIWLLFGGLILAFFWVLTGIFMAITIIGLPWVKSCFVMAGFVLWPFGREAVSRKKVTGKDDIGTGILGLIANIIWFICCGIALAIGHLVSALLCFITIIGIPFGFQHLKMINISLCPVGKTIVPIEK